MHTFSRRIANWATSLLLWILSPLLLPTAASTIDLISQRDPSLSPTQAGSGVSYGQVFSADGKHLVFSSGAQNLTETPKSAFRVDLYDFQGPDVPLRLLTAPLDGGFGEPGQMTAVGFGSNSIVYLGNAPDLVSGSTNSYQQLYVQDLTTGARRLLTKQLGSGKPITQDVTYAVVSQSGRYVFFETAATGLFSGSTGGLTQIYRADLENEGAIMLVSHQSHANGLAESRYLSGTTASADGNVAAYVAVTSGQPPVAVVNDLSTNILDTISVGATPSPNDLYNLELSADAKYLAVRHTGAIPSTDHGIYWIDLDTHEKSFCTAGMPGYFQGDDSTFAPLILFPDQPIVAFETLSTNQTIRKINFWSPQRGLFGMDGLLSFVPFVSMEPTDSSAPVLSPDGTVLAFVSSDTNVVSGVNDGLPHLYTRVLISGVATLVSQDAQHTPILADPEPAIIFSPNNSQVALTTPAPGLFEGDDNELPDVYLFDLATQGFTLVSASSPALTRAAANGTTTFGANSMSGDGRYVVFSSLADDLFSADLNSTWDVFLADRQLNTLRKISSSQPGTTNRNAGSLEAQITPNGRFVLFQSYATNLVTTPVPARYNVYRYDTQSGETLLASPSSAVDATSLPTSHASISSDGRFVVYELGGNAAILRDLVNKTSTRVGISAVITPNSSVLSPDGGFVAYSTSTSLFIQRNPDQAPVAIPAAAGVRYVPPFQPSMDGTQLGFADTSRKAFYLADIATVHVAPFRLTNVFGFASAAMNANARYVALDASLGTTNSSVYQIVLLDTQTGILHPISTNLAGAYGNGTSRDPAISADGRFITFKSEASSLVTNDGNNTQDIFVHDSLLGTTELVSHTPEGLPASDRSLRTDISGDGSTIIFLSVATDLVKAAYNGFPQLFVASFPSPLADSDHDGLDDAWELAHFGNLNQGANDDPDHDGANNLAEFTAHTDPMDTASVLRLSIRLADDTAIQFSWPTMAGVRYQVQFATGLGSTAWQDFGTPVDGTGETAHSLPATPPDTQRYYRLLVLP
ncbi:MAG TPA: hypothetical protein VMF06_11440 [Candidatus Limnocylindria bacterium]|nr:hypothetical protein [Candidatus Limnocylindria bacterium]